MKALFLILLALFPLLSFAQSQVEVVNQQFNAKEITLNPETKKYTAQDVIPIPSKNAAQLMEGSYKWLAEIKYANSLASKGLEMDEAVFNRIRVNQYLISAQGTEKYKIRFTLILEFRDGRYKYEYSDFVLYDGSRINFEDINLSSKEKSVLARHLVVDINAYIKTSIEELSSFLVSYQPDNSW